MIQVKSRPLIKPGTEEKSGCLWCSLLPYCTDFPQYGPAYGRDAEKILAKEPEGHVVRTRGVQDPEQGEVDILFVGEAPGADEDRNGAPFVGRSGTLLRRSIEEYIGDDYTVGFANVVRCRPPRNRNPNKTEVKCCTPELVREINRRKPKLIVACGNHSLTFLTGQSGITTLTGKMLDCIAEGIKEPPRVLGCLHPAYVLRFDHELERFIEAIETARAFVEGTYEEAEGIGEYHTLDTLDAVEALLEALAEAPRFYFDTETGSLNWWQEQFPRLLCLSFSDEPGFGFTVPLDHADSPWREGGPKAYERPKLIAMLAEFFENHGHKGCAQNGKFDRKQLLAALGVEVKGAADTMLTHLVLDERRGTHGLKTLSYHYSGMGGYEKELDDWIADHPECNPKRGGSYANIPGHILFRYAAMDTDVTCRADLGMRSEKQFVDSPKLQALADVFLPALSDALADMEYAGAQVDTEVVDLLDRKYLGEMRELQAKIDTLPEVKAFEEAMAEEKEAPDFRFNPRSPKQLQEILFSPDYYGDTPVHLTKTGLQRLSLRYDQALAKHAAKRKGKKPDFTDVVKTALKDGQYQHFSTDAEVLQVLETRGNSLARLILEYRAVSVLHGTFVKPLQTKLDPDGLIHGDFLPHGTQTGRLASRDPNLQNIPNKGGGLIKRAYVSRFGDEGVIGQVDLSQAELRVAACYFGEQTMIDAYVEGVDIHTLTAVAISKLTAEEYEELDADDKKQWRTRAKRINFGILYGGGPDALVNTLKKDGVFISRDEAEAMIEVYFQARPALKKGMDALEKEVLKTGVLETFTGRRRRVPEVNSVDHKLRSRAVRQSINFPIQSIASDLTLMSLVRINRALRNAGFVSRAILTVHDSIIFDMHVDEMEAVMSYAKHTMETIPEWSDEVLPGLDWSWLTVPIVADCEVGFSWGTLCDFDPDEYDVDELWEKMEEKQEFKEAA